MAENTTQATVVIEDWPADAFDQGSQFIAQDNGIWADYLLRNRYEKDGHVYMLGCTSPNGFGSNSDTVAFCQIACSTVLWIADWTAARFGSPPTIPDPNIYQSRANNNWVLLDVHYDVGNVTLPADGATPYFRISGTYYYGHKRPTVDITKLMAFPKPPWIANFFNRTIPSNDLFEKDLIYPVTTKPERGSVGDLQNPTFIPR